MAYNGYFKVENVDSDIIPSVFPGRKPRGLSKITIHEANARSNPPLGPELIEKVESAKANGEVPMVYDSSVVRYVDGKWMAPQMCNRYAQLILLESATYSSQLSRKSNQFKAAQQNIQM